MEKLIQEIKDVCDGYMGIIITNEVAEKIFNEHPSIRKWGANDTEERGNIINFVCLDICGMKCPEYRDTKEYEKIFKKGIVENAALKGYELDKEVWSEEK